MYDFESLPQQEKVRQNAITDAVSSKAKWAHDQIADLRRDIDGFIKSSPYVIRTEIDVELGQRTYRFAGANPFPRSITGRVGDILYDLRSALDHLAWQLVIANGGSPDSNTGFPIYDPTALSSKELKSLLGRKERGMRQEAKDAIARLKPHKGGDRTLWLIHELNRIDKHREIIGIGTSHIAHSASPSQKRQISEAWKRTNPATSAAAPDFAGLMVAVPGIRILKPGDEILRVSDADYDPHMKIHLDVAFHVQGVIEGVGVLPTLEMFKNRVLGVILDFSRDGCFRLNL